MKAYSLFGCFWIESLVTPMRIGINASFVRKPGTGIGQVSFHVLGFLPRVEGVEYTVYLEETPEADMAWTKRDDIRIIVGLPVLWRRDDLVRRVLWEVCWLPRRVRRDGCDVLVSLYQSATVARGMRHIMLVHDAIPRIFPQYLDNARKRLYDRLVGRAIRAATRVATVSEWSRRDIAREYSMPQDRIVVVPIDVDPIFRQAVGDDRRTDVLRRHGLSAGYVYYGGGLELRKNVLTLLAAYRRLVDRGLSSGQAVPPLVISGKLIPELAPLVTDVEKEVRERNLGPYVRVLGFVSQEDLPAIYAGARVFVYPSVYEGFGMPVLEAMHQGVAVLSSNASSLPEVGGDAVEYFRPTDVTELSEKLARLLDDPARCHEIARAGRLRAEAFSWESFVTTLMRLVSDE